MRAAAAFRLAHAEVEHYTLLLAPHQCAGAASHIDQNLRGKFSDSGVGSIGFAEMRCPRSLRLLAAQTRETIGGLLRGFYMAISVTRPHIVEGLPFPLGATWDGLGVNFALFSAHAAKVELCLFDDTGERELHRVELPEFTDEVWHGYLRDAWPGTVYGYRIHGPYAPEAGHRFNPHKLLLDPYAKALVGSLKWGPELFGYALGATGDDLSYDERDSSPLMPKCRVVDPAFTWGRDREPASAWERTIIYEVHVKGFTQLHPAVPQKLRGSFAGLATEAVVEYVRALGATAVELLPVHAFIDDRLLLDKGLRNYWGYNTIGFFAPDPRYSATGSTREFKEMVARLHDAGLEVILDVVYNHTAEGSERGPTLSFRGIDNVSYYRLLPDKPRYYINDTGTGNTVNLSHPRVLQMVTDSLRYWVTEMHVDGFRFDLATILGREPAGFDEGGGFLDSCRQDPVLSRVKLIAEPWDCGPRIPGGRLSSWMGGVERPLSRCGEALLERRLRAGSRTSVAARGVGRFLQPPRPQAVGEHQFHHGARRLYA
jgi:glycogen operon protein